MKFSIFNQFSIFQLVKQAFFFFSPLLVFTIFGKSMEPTLQEGQKVIVVKKWFIPIYKDTIVVAKDPRSERVLIKRVKETRNNHYFLLGDNKKESTDSRDFGWIQKSDIIGKVIYSF